MVFSGDRISGLPVMGFYSKKEPRKRKLCMQVTVCGFWRRNGNYVRVVARAVHVQRSVGSFSL